MGCGILIHLHREVTAHATCECTQQTQYYGTRRSVTWILVPIKREKNALRKLKLNKTNNRLNCSKVRKYVNHGKKGNDCKRYLDVQILPTRTIRKVWRIEKRIAFWYWDLKHRYRKSVINFMSYTILNNYSMSSRWVWDDRYHVQQERNKIIKNIQQIFLDLSDFATQERPKTI